MEAIYRVHGNFFFNIWWTHVLLWGHWYPCFGLLVTSPLGFKAKAEVNLMSFNLCTPLQYTGSRLQRVIRCKIFERKLLSCKRILGSLIHTWQKHTWCTFPYIHLCSDTCWPLGVQHGSRAILIHILVNKHWWGLSLESITLLLHSLRPGRHSTDWDRPVRRVRRNIILTLTYGMNTANVVQKRIGQKHFQCHFGVFPLILQCVLGDR